MINFLLSQKFMISKQKKLEQVETPSTVHKFPKVSNDTFNFMPAKNWYYDPLKYTFRTVPLTTNLMLALLLGDLQSLKMNLLMMILKLL